MLILRASSGGHSRESKSLDGPSVIPLVIVLTGPSGVGKDAVVNRAQEHGASVVRPATMTTRRPREGEVEGVHHYFVTRDEFLAQVAAGELLEHAEVYGNLYGVPRRSVRDALKTGQHVIIRVDVQGAESLREVLPDALFVALEPSDNGALRDHLEGRASETTEQVERRLAIAADEVARAREFCVPLVNVEGDLDATVDAFLELITREQARGDRVAVRV
ncbi:MAG: guanylate kinase [Chloroflexi bacterium]|nr:guanylate kinase [Chloroflexota bacterium]MQC47475.1 guanylate kinase [Chloroflexota bacterium]